MAGSRHYAMALGEYFPHTRLRSTFACDGNIRMELSESRNGLGVCLCVRWWPRRDAPDVELVVFHNVVEVPGVLGAGRVLGLEPEGRRRVRGKGVEVDRTEEVAGERR